jgi:hypothetical protein
VLLGNHDLMSLVRDLRYVEKRNYADYSGSEKAEDRRREWEGFRATHAGRASGQQLREAFDDHYPPGYFARLEAMSPQGVYGAWLLQRPAVIKLDRGLYVHGGLTKETAELGLEGINRELQERLQEFLRLQDKISELNPFTPNYAETYAWVDQINSGNLRGRIPGEYVPVARRLQELTETLPFDVRGPLWLRQLALENENLLGPVNRFDDILESLDAEYIVIAHTPTWNYKITSRMNEKIIRIDVAMVYFAAQGHPEGNPWALVIEGGGDEKRGLRFRPPEKRTPPFVEDPQGQERSSILEQLPERELLDYLKKAKITGISSVFTDEERSIVIYEVEHEDLEQRVAFNAGEERPDRNDPQPRLRRYQHMVAAYRISRMLEMDIVPPTILRKIDRQEGSLVLYPETAVSRPWLESSGQLQAYLEELHQEVTDARGFAALLDIEDQLEEARSLLRKERRILLGDLTRGFSTSSDIQERYRPATLGSETRIEEPLSPYLELKLQELNRKDLRKELKKLLSDEQIDALLGRRDKLLEISAAFDRR